VLFATQCFHQAINYHYSHITHFISTFISLMPFFHYFSLWLRHILDFLSFSSLSLFFRWYLFSMIFSFFRFSLFILHYFTLAIDFDFHSLTYFLHISFSLCRFIYFLILLHFQLSILLLFIYFSHSHDIDIFNNIHY